jgi:hypothetical protein
MSIQFLPAQGLIDSADNSPTQNTPSTTPQLPHDASAGPALPNDGTVSETPTAGLLQDGQIGFTVAFMGTDFLSLYFEF